MNYDALKQEIIDHADELGIDKIGFTSADFFSDLKGRLMRQEALNYQSGFEEKDIDKRVTPSLLMHEPKSIISIALAYPSKMKDAPRSKRGERRGIFARASWGEDYHTVLREALERLEAFIQKRVPDARMKSMVDTGELVDRAVAERAGVGWSAKNCSIITPEFGSYVYLGEMITNIPFSPDESMEDQCGDCNLCVDVCPTGALVQGGQLDAKKCIAFLTQTKDFLPDEYRSKIGNRLYGCDTCQTVCPKNKGIDMHIHPEFEPDPEIAKPLLEPLLSISNREFKEQYGHVSGSWRGKKPIQRNALIALAHFKEVSALPSIFEVMQNDVRPVMRGTAAWAAGKIGGEEAEEMLLKQKEVEQDEEVLIEIEKGLSLCK